VVDQTGGGMRSGPREQVVAELEATFTEGW
jgi:hypothetical protein